VLNVQVSALEWEDLAPHSPAETIRERGDDLKVSLLFLKNLFLGADSFRRSTSSSRVALRCR
jgi:hypothetical protein